MHISQVIDAHFPGLLGGAPAATANESDFGGDSLGLAALSASPSAGHVTLLGSTETEKAAVLADQLSRDRALHCGQPALVFVDRDDVDWLVAEHLAALSRVQFARIRRSVRDAEERSRVAQAGRVLASTPIWFASPPREIEDLVEFVRFFRMERQAAGDEAVPTVRLDRVHEFRVSTARQTIEENTGAVVRELKAGARRVGVAILAVAVIRHPGEETRGDLSVSDMKGSGELEAASDAVFLLNLQPADHDTRDVVLDLAKNKHGPQTHLDLSLTYRLRRFDRR
ncbi:MAG: hypothetical protein KC503_13625 [Myxococcales bacterium]|nr:hypothetical protein [Myxococcales bacterium]